MPKNSKVVKRELDDEVIESVKDLLSNEDSVDDAFKKSELIVNVQEEKDTDIEEGSEIEDERPAWNSKLQYILAQVGFSVGLGNVWRFPYLCQKNGGGAYLLPYLILLLVIGIPLFFLELSVGQRIRRGSIGVWNYISPKLGGIGFASCVVCFFVALYYNVIIGWSLFYFSQSFQQPLPWDQCPLVKNASHTRKTYTKRELVKSYLTGTMYTVWVMGTLIILTQALEIMLEPKVWREAATQVFFALGLGFGGVIAFSSYNKRDNNCHFDAVLVSFINFFTSVLATLVVFAVLGFKANVINEKCIEIYTKELLSAHSYIVLFFRNSEMIIKFLKMGNISQDIIPHHVNLSAVTEEDYHLVYDIIQKVKEEEFPVLHLNSCQIGDELNKVSKQCLSNKIIVIQLKYALSTNLGFLAPFLFNFKAYLLIILLKCFMREMFMEDLRDMLGFAPSRYYYYIWKYISPLMLLSLLIASVVNMGLSPPGYNAWIEDKASEEFLSYPTWGMVVCIALMVLAILPVPVVFIVRRCNLIDDSSGNLASVTYKRGRVLKEPVNLEGDDASLIHGKIPSEMSSPNFGKNIYRKQSGSPTLDTAPNGRYGIGYLMADMPDMPESDL
uniref:Transporter n=1 Tax=Propithecus coquereli TaxID=379532 RepID=A0A2K6FYR6_PROCO